MGAHIAGLVGKLLKESEDSLMVGTIVGIDPASLLFSPLEKDPHCLTHKDAWEVIIFHATVRKFLGIGFILGHKDYFFDGGESVVAGNSGLSHMRAVELFRELLWVTATGWVCTQPKPNKVCSTENLERKDIDLSEMMTETLRDFEVLSGSTSTFPIYVATNIEHPYFVEVKSDQKPKSIPSYIEKKMDIWKKIKYQMKSDEKLGLIYE